ncbi:hypothetical protein Tco_1473492 [Tanacetum coccineum]
MSSITAQQTKLDLELVPKENNFDIGKCNGRIPRGLTPREPTFQVVLDAIALTLCYPAFLITADIPEIDKKKRFKLTLEVFRDIFKIFPRVHGREFDPLPSKEDTVSFLRVILGRSIHSMMLLSIRCINPRELLLLLSTRVYLERLVVLTSFVSPKLKSFGIENRVYKKQEKMYYPRFTKVIIHHFLIQEKSLSWRNKIRMHNSKDDYLINSLRFVSAKESSQKYRAVLPECLTSHEMKESKAYKTYLGHATDEEPITKGKRIKRSVKKSSTKPTTSIVIREPPVETKSKGKEKEKVDVAYGKGIELLSEVVLTEKAQLKEVRKKSLRDFHNTHPSGSGTVSKKPPSVEKITPIVTSEGTGDKPGVKITPIVTSEGTGDKPGVPDVTVDDSTESESESWGNDEDDINNKQEASNEGGGQENESEEQESDSKQDEESDDDNQEEEEVDQENESEDDEIESDEDKGMDDTTDQFDDDVDARLEEPTQTGKEVVQGEGADVEMNEAQQGNENLVTTQEQVVDDAHVIITTVTKKTEVPVTSSSRSSDLASKFLNFSDIPQTDAEIVSPLDVHVHHEVPRTQAPTLLTIPVSVITESSPVYTNIPQSSQTFTPLPILTTPTPPPIIETTNPLSTLLDFASVFRFNDRITTLEKEVAKIKKDPLHTQVTSLVDEHLDTRLGETREEFMNFLSESLTTRIKEILLDKMEKNFFYSYDVYSLKRGRKDKDKDEDPSAGSDRGLKKRKLSKDAEPTTGPKKKDSTSGSSKGTKSQPKSSGKSVQSEEPVFEVADSDMPQDQEGNLGDNEDEPRNETASRRDWFKKPTPPQEPTDPDWNIGKTTQEGPTQNWLMTLAASTSTDKSLKDFDELMSTPIDFSGYILNGLKIENLTQEVLIGPSFKLLKGTRSNYAELEYDFKKCYKALSEKLDWENPNCGDYPFDLSKPLPLITRGKHQRVPFEFFINNDLKYLQGGISTIIYTTFTTKTKAAKYDLPSIKDMVPNIWSLVKVAYDRYAL